MVGKLADGVVALAGAPFGLIGGEAGDGDVCRNKPIFLVVCGVKLLKQDATQGGGLGRGRAGAGAGAGVVPVPDLPRSGEGQGEDGDGNKKSQFSHGSDLR